MKLHQREFETLPEAWSKLLTAYNSIKVFTSPFQSYAAVGRMTDLELDDFLNSTEFTTTEKTEIKSSRDRDQTFQKVTFWFRLNKAYGACRDSNEFLQKNAIFMPVSIKEKFDAIGDLVWDALTEHKIKEEMKIGKNAQSKIDFRRRARLCCANWKQRFRSAYGATYTSNSHDQKVAHSALGNSSHPRRAVASRRSDPQGLDNLHHVAGRGIIRDGFAAKTMDMQIPTWRPGRWIADGHVTCNIQCSSGQCDRRMVDVRLDTTLPQDLPGRRSAAASSARNAAPQVL